MTDNMTSNSEVSQAPEPTSYVVEGNSYRELIAQRDAYKRVANDLARQLRERTPADTSTPPERAAHEPGALPAHAQSVLINAAQLIDGIKNTAPQEWTDWDQQVRDSISALLATKPAQADLARVVDARASEPPPDGCGKCSNVAPIAKIMVADGFVSWGRLYAPGLPTGQHDLYPSASTPPPPAGLLFSMRDWIESAPHGDNCFVTDEYPGNQCVCGKESLSKAMDDSFGVDEPSETKEAVRRCVVCQRELSQFWSFSYCEDHMPGAAGETGDGHG